MSINVVGTHYSVLKVNVRRINTSVNCVLCTLISLFIRVFTGPRTYWWCILSS